MSEAKYNYECCEWDKDYAREYIEELKQQNKELIDLIGELYSEGIIHNEKYNERMFQLLRKHTEEVKG